jgi:hypothetical protein
VLNLAASRGAPEIWFCRELRRKVSTMRASCGAVRAAERLSTSRACQSLDHRSGLPGNGYSLPTSARMIDLSPRGSCEADVALQQRVG